MVTLNDVLFYWMTTCSADCKPRNTMKSTLMTYAELEF